MKAMWACSFLWIVSCVASQGRYKSEPGDAYTEFPAASGDDGYFLGEAPEAEGSSLGRRVSAAEIMGKVREPLQAPMPAAPPDEPADARQVIYSAGLRLVVVSAREAHASILAIAKEAGGHLQESDASSVTVRVPAAAFEGVIARISSLGEVVESNIHAADVTEEMLDLGIRLENARKARERLLEHLAKSDKVEDTLKIEMELTRVTGEIERIEGRQRYLQSQIAMSTIRVDLNTNQPQRSGDELETPFEWIARLGDGLVAGTLQGMPRKPRFLARGPKFEPPPGFVRYYSSKGLVEAMDAGDLRLKLQVHDNYDEGALAFWSELARKALVQRRALAVSEERELGGNRTLLIGTREVGKAKLGYLLVLARTEDDLYTFEAWGPQETFERSLQALIASAQSLKL
jgi:uncharacterized protein DUF4349